MDAADYRHVVLGLIFLKYNSDAFEPRRVAVLAEGGEDAAETGTSTRGREHLLGNARGPVDASEGLSQAVDRRPDRRRRHGRDRAPQPALADALPRDYVVPPSTSSASVDWSTSSATSGSATRTPARATCSAASTSTSSHSASAEGKKGGEFYTPCCVAKVLVEMLKPYRGPFYDPCCGSSGMCALPVPDGPWTTTGTGEAMTRVI